MMPVATTTPSSGAPFRSKVKQARATLLAIFDLNFFRKEAEMVVVPQREEALCPILLPRSV
jgi:hypothetical protein